MKRTVILLLVGLLPWPAYPVAFGILIVVCLLGARIGKRWKTTAEVSA